MSLRLIQHRNARFMLGWMVIATLAFHGLIPLGYMPDISPQSKHPMQMSICSGMDMSSMDDEADNSNTPANDKTDKKSSDHAPCPFSVNAIFSFSNPVPDLAAPIFLFIAVVSFASFLLASRRRYINASPRAPPLAA